MTLCSLNNLLVLLLAVAIVATTKFYGELKGSEAEQLMKQYAQGLRLEHDFFDLKRNSKFATLIWFSSIQSLNPLSVAKSDRRPWVVLSSELKKDADIKLQMNLFVDGQNCPTGLHSYHNSKRFNSKGYLICKYCGEDTIDWVRIHRRNFKDVDYLVSQLKTDMFRSEWWKKMIDAKALNHALRKGKKDLCPTAFQRLKNSIGKVYPFPDGSLKPFRDGYQTPFLGNSIFYAQHALACCCRKCLKIWHGIPNGRNLTDSELNYFVRLVMFYIEDRIPQLKNRGIVVPKIQERP